MDLDKSLYMKEFHHMRENIGTTEYYPVHNILFTNLYDEFKSKNKIKEVEEVIENIQDIQDKTIHLLKKEDQHVFFPDLPDLPDLEDGQQKKIVNEIKKIQVSEGIDMKGDVKPVNVKSITIDPKYVPTDS
jgi:hypothetical protein